MKSITITVPGEDASEISVSSPQSGTYGEITVTPIIAGLPDSSVKLNAHQVNTTNNTAISLYAEELEVNKSIRFSIFLEMTGASIKGSGMILGHADHNSAHITSSNYFESVVDSVDTLPGENDEPAITYDYSYMRRGTQERNSPIDVVLKSGEIIFLLYGDPQVAQEWIINRLDIY